jgi:hypothetical protein
VRHIVVLLVVSLPLTDVCVARAATEPPKPRLGLFVEQSDIARARQRAETLPWAKAYRERTMKVADAWVARSDEWIREVLPKPGADFSYGSTGCPNCGKEWGRFGSLVASLDRPLVLICPHCKTEFDLNHPKEPYNDTGDGVVVNGRRFWLRGVWNAFVVDQMWSAFHAENAAIVNLADAYALSGDDRYARKAIVIMDALATLAPQTAGPADFATNPKGDEGRLQHLTSMMFRAQVHFARALDLVGRHDDLLKPSPTNGSRGSAWENIRYGIFEEYLFIPLDVRGGKLHTLHNHEADSVRAMLLHGLMFGNADHVRWGAEATAAFLNNTIDRDGMYYETSLTYADFTRSVFIDLGELLVRYDPGKYPASAEMPKRADLPLAGNYFNHAGLARLTLDVPWRVSMLGRGVTYGNNHFDERVWKKPGRAFYRPELMQAQRFYLYSTGEPRRAKAARIALAHLAQAGEQGVGGWWALYRAPNDALLRDAAGIADPTTQPTPQIPTEDRSDFLGQSGLVFLRSGEDEHRRGAVMRVGPTLPHGHDDVGALLLFANGRALSGDIGYGIFGNHTHLGWASRGVAHHAVVVNQDETNPDQLFRIGPGGTIERFYDGGSGGGGVALAEASLGAMYPKADGVRDARRMIVQLDLWPTQSYWVDLFDVDGGRVHDYAMHAKPLGENGSFTIDGAEPKPQDGVWTLAGLDPKWRDVPFNNKGQSWGERLTLNGMIAPISGLKDGVEDKRGWYPPPGNGYAFLHDVNSAPGVAEPWSAMWRWEEEGDRFGLRMTMLPDKPQQVISAVGPNLNGTDRMNFVIARHGEPASKENIRSRYAAVLEPFGADAPVVTAEVVRQGDRVAAIRTRAEAREDLILDARHARVDPTNLPGLDAGVAVVRRRSGGVAALVLHGGTKLEVDRFALQFATNRHTAKITAIDDTSGTFRITPPLPVASIGSAIRVSNPAYSHGSLYRVADIGVDGDLKVLNSELTLGRGRVEAVKEGDVFTSSAPLVYGFEYGRSTRFLDGKRIVLDDQSGTIVAQTDFKDIKVAGVKPEVGSEFTVYDVQVGDTVEMDAAASLVEERGEWALRANATVDVRFPFAVERATGESWFAVGERLKVESLDLSAGPVRFRRAK